MKKLLKSPWLELTTLCVVVALSYIALMFISKGAETPAGGMSLNNLALLTFGFFLLSFAIAIIAVIAGIGGGVLFTPLMLAFTPIDSLMVYSSYVQLDNKASFCYLQDIPLGIDPDPASIIYSL